MNVPFVNQINDYISDNKLFDLSQKVLVALSGGADSVALLSVLIDLGYKCVAAHCNFHLRGDESNRDQSFVEKLCDKMGIVVHIQEFEVDKYISAKGCSVEMACRELRYQWFSELISQGVADVLAVGHHIEDNVETLMLNLMRGTGVSGIGGMRPRNTYIVRPLLSSTRADIEEYLLSRELTWITDSTNLSNQYKRNKLRNIVIPTWDSAFPGIVGMIGRSLSYLREGVDFWQDMVCRLKEKYIVDDIVYLKSLIESEQHCHLLLFEWLKPENFDAATVTDILNSVNESGRSFFSRTGVHRLIDRGRLMLIRQPNHDICQNINIQSYPFKLEYVDRCDANVKTSSAYEASFDIELLDNSPRFELRSWKIGDRIAPFGMSGTKKVSDIFRDFHIAECEKKRPVVLTRNGEIIWLVGMRHTRLFSVRKDATRFLRLTFDESYF